MEKIYVEKSQKNQDKKFFQSKSVIGTFALAVIAVAAIVIAGLNQTSYAIPDEEEFPESFKTSYAKDSFLTTDISGGAGFSPYYATYGNVTKQIFCMEHGVNFAADTTLNRKEAISDYGLLYLMANIYPNVEFMDGSANRKAFSKEVQTWISQVAIWEYLDATVTGEDARKNIALTENDKNFMEKAKAVCYGDETNPTCYKVDGTSYQSINGTGEGTTSNDKTFYEVYIKPIVDEAIANRSKPNKILKVNMADDITVTSDEKYYQSSEISVSADPSDSNSFHGYMVKLEEAPEGTIVVDPNGEEIKDLNNFSGSSKFYIRVPINKVTEENKTVKFSVTGSFSSYEGHYYKDDNGVAQTVSTVYQVNSNFQTGAEFTLNYTPEVPDTGLSTAQTVYFIGLIVLLSGLGIIYANVKPSESK